MRRLSVSIVVYRSDPEMLSRGIDSLARAVARLGCEGNDDARVEVALIDNGAAHAADHSALPEHAERTAEWLDIDVRAGHGNIGYGAGHNLAILRARSRYHLILNPDVDLDEDALVRALDFLDAEPSVVALSPRIRGEAGQLQYLCRRYPTLLDLFIRGFLPASWRVRFDARLARYEMRADTDRLESLREPGLRAAMYPKIISGCFMLFRTDILQSLGGFDPRYFLYFEDYDLSLRAGEAGRLAYVPSVDIVHYGGGASRKGGRHIRLFLCSAAQFFRRFGWRVS